MKKPSATHRFLRAALALTLLAACAPAPAPHALPLELPGTFSASGAEPLPQRWWLALDDPALDALVERALSGSFTLKVAWDRLDQAEATARKAGAPLLPSLDAEGSVTHSRLHGEGSDRFTLGLAAAYEVDLWGRLRSARDAAALDARGAGDDLRAAAVTLSAEVASTWYRLVEARGQLELLAAQEAVNRQLLELVTLRFRTGQVGIADVLQQRQLVEANVGELAQAEARAGELEHSLAILLGAPPGEAVGSRKTALPGLPSLPETGLPAELLERRPDLRAAWRRVLAADRTLAAAVADRLPRLSLGAGLDSSSASARDLFDNWLTSLAANLAAPLVDGGRRRAEVERSRAAAGEALHLYGQLVLEALAEVEDALLRERQQRRFLESLDRQQALAATVVERVRERYTRGSVDYQRVLDALLSEQRLQRSRLTARRELLEERIALCRTLAGGWEPARPGNG